ncbi:MAG: phosphoribosylaminoimidazolesuccinocarboxamide synthase [Candidatus Sumerlaeaceae bacterium]
MVLYSSDLPLPLLGRGKVRDIYACESNLLLVATDRLSAFDVVFGDPIPWKGPVLNQLSAYWFERTKHIVPNHLITALPRSCGDCSLATDDLWGRVSLCRKVQPIAVECVVRGYLEGSAWQDYQKNQTVCGIRLPAGLKRRAKLPTPIFTPTTKAQSGHDQPISFEDVVEMVGVEVAEMLRIKSIELYSFAHEQLLAKGILISDTKFEFGFADGEVILIDEALTPDSSRFWEAAPYLEGGQGLSLDKQFVRDYVESIGWNKQPPAPRLPQEVIHETSRRYLEIFRRITGTSLESVLQRER